MTHLDSEIVAIGWALGWDLAVLSTLHVKHIFLIKMMDSMATWSTVTSDISRSGHTSGGTVQNDSGARNE
jgi:hypothetical protein